MFDTATLISIARTQMNLPVTFDSSYVNYGLVSFGGTDSTIVVHPTNSANQVAKVIKTNTAEVWAGTTISMAVNPAPWFSAAIPFTASENDAKAYVYNMLGDEVVSKINFQTTE